VGTPVTVSDTGPAVGGSVGGGLTVGDIEGPTDGVAVGPKFFGVGKGEGATVSCSASPSWRALMFPSASPKKITKPFTEILPEPSIISVQLPPISLQLMDQASFPPASIAVTVPSLWKVGEQSSLQQEAKCKFLKLTCGT